MPISPPHTVLDGSPSELTINLDDGTDERVSIIVIHKDRPELLSMCLQSIAVTSVNNNIEIIVVDNGSSTRDSIDYLAVLEKNQDIKIIRNETNKWWATACNQGAKAADRRAKYLVFMHQDCVVLHPAWIDLMISIGEAQGSGFIGLEEGHFTYDRKKIPYVKEWCLMISRECWQQCGPFAEELKQVGSSFVMTIAAQKEGFKPTIVGKLALVHHYSAFSMDSSEFEKMGEQSASMIPKIIRGIQQKS